MKEKIRIYFNPRCSKCRESLELLNEANCEVEIIEYLKNTPSKKELMHILTLLKIPAFDLIRKNEDVFKQNYVGKNLSEQEWIQAMVKFPKLIERPIVIQGNKAVIGRPPSLVLDLVN